MRATHPSLPITPKRLRRLGRHLAGLYIVVSLELVALCAIGWAMLH